MSAEALSQAVAQVASERANFDGKHQSEGESSYKYIQRINTTLGGDDDPSPTPSVQKATTDTPSSTYMTSFSELKRTVSTLTDTQKKELCTTLACASKSSGGTMRWVLEVLFALACVTLVVIVARRERNSTKSSNA